MPRPNHPPTPASSTDITAKDHSSMEGVFTLPPPAISARAKQSKMQSSPPDSPIEKVSNVSLQRKRTLSGTGKQNPDTMTSPNVDLPPPPSRARKIIQMKPKQTDESTSPPTSAQKPQSSSKRKQPSATSAAGRKIARKTAHSIIERRRRSKMNEEFGVLKDMIPACEGVEMHKLAILQAGIDYVRYLQGCVEKLQNQRGNEQDGQEEFRSHRATSTGTEESNAYRRGSIATTTTSSANPSPNLGPTNSTQSTQRIAHPSTSYSTSPPPLVVQTPVPTGVSPAFNAIHFSPDLARTSTYNSVHHASNSAKPSPTILPLPQAALPMNGTQSEGAAEATATAALMMLTNDRRGASRGGMSVKELLSG